MHANQADPNWQQSVLLDDEEPTKSGTSIPAEQQAKKAFEKSRPVEPQRAAVTLEDFYAYMPSHNYIFMPTREAWPSSSVNAQLKPVAVRNAAGLAVLIPVLNAAGEQVLNTDGKPKMKTKTTTASTYLDRHRSVQQMTWAPGELELIRDKLLVDGGWVNRTGASGLNLYRPPSIVLGDAALAGPWIKLIRKVYPNDADHIIKWCAQRVQQPSVKLNHGLVIGGVPGIGKDTMFEPLREAIGPWNMSEIAPHHLFDKFNEHIKSIVLRISEAKDEGGEIDRYQFHEKTKVLMASPPDTMLVNPKYLRQHQVLNVVGVIITTNHKTGSIHLPADDRRHYVAWSDCEQSDFETNYWNEMYAWYRNGGFQHVAAYLAGLDISSFDPKAPPPKTDAFWTIVGSNRSQEENELADVLDKLKNPPAVTVEMIRDQTNPDDKDGLGGWIRDRRNRRTIPHRLHELGYDPIRNPTAESDGEWKINGKRHTVYAQRELTKHDQIKAAQDLAKAF
jgi:hypothetical protein